MMRPGCLYKIVWLISFTALLLTGCRGGTPKTEFYTLSAISKTQANTNIAATRQPASVGVGPVDIPEVLDRPQIVTRTSPNKLHIDEFHRWAGRLDEDVARVVAENIAVLLPTEQVAVYPWDVNFKPDYQVTLDILQFEGRMGKDVILEVLWRVIDGQKRTTLYTKKSLVQEPLADEDYETLVVTKSRIIESFSKIIIKKLNNLIIKN